MARPSDAIDRWTAKLLRLIQEKAVEMNIDLDSLRRLRIAADISQALVDALNGKQLRQIDPMQIRQKQASTEPAAALVDTAAQAAYGRHTVLRPE